MHFRMNIKIIMFFVCCISQMIVSNQIYDWFDSAPLIEYVEEKEIEIERAKIYLDYLYDKYFYTEKFISDYIPTDKGVIIVYTYRIARRIHTTDANLAEYQNVKNNFDLLIDDAVEHIKMMVFNGASLYMYDQYGNSVVNYCYTKEIYDVLRDLGAPFSLQAWAYFYPDEAIIAGCSGFVTGIVIAVALTARYRAYYS